MNNFLKCCFLFLIFAYHQGFSEPLDRNSYWQCTTQDRDSKEWSARSGYQKVAVNMSFAQCKKESRMPSTCKVSSSNCEGFNQGVSIRPVWRCTALDLNAAPWRSNFYPQIDDAALAAKAFCKEKSTIPDTCYINLVTCMNYINGERM